MQRIAVVALLLVLVIGANAPRAAESAAPMEFDRFYMVFLYRGDNPPQLDEASAAELQEAHLKHMEQLWLDGYALVAGPFGGGPDDPLRGIVLFRGDLDIEKVRELGSRDPAVKAGRLKVEVRPWYTGAGYLAFPKQPPAD